MRPRGKVLPSDRSRDKLMGLDSNEIHASVSDVRRWGGLQWCTVGAREQIDDVIWRLLPSYIPLAARRSSDHSLTQY